MWVRNILDDGRYNYLKTRHQTVVGLLGRCETYATSYGAFPCTSNATSNDEHGQKLHSGRLDQCADGFVLKMWSEFCYNTKATFQLTPLPRTKYGPALDYLKNV